MLGDLINTLSSLHQIHGGILFALAPFTLFAWIAYKLMQKLIHSGNTIIIAVIGFFALVSVNASIGQGSILQALFFAVPLVFIGHEVYKRLIV